VGFLIMAFLEASKLDLPTGGVSQLAWVIIGCLVTAIVSICAFARHWTNRLYNDLKECTQKRLEQEEEVLGLLKVLRLQMEQSRGGKIR
jgi:hypothetical protein